MSLWNIWRSVSAAGHFASVFECVARVPFLFCLLLRASSSNPYFARWAESVSRDNLQQWPRGKRCRRWSKTTHTQTLTAHTQQLRGMTTASCCWPLSCSKSRKELVWLAENANGGRALLTALPMIFQTVQESEPLTFPSSHKPASLTFEALLTSHFPPYTIFKTNFLSLFLRGTFPFSSPFITHFYPLSLH